jgi:2-polyprenyl-6-methoxyphenol hydroxylase-like FAD-dependent oxidoreductase
VAWPWRCRWLPLASTTSTSAIRELGVGINVLPHGVRELAELGLLRDLYDVGIPTADCSYYTRRGQRIWHEPLGLAAGYRWPQFSIHRGELLGILYRAVVDRLGVNRIHSDHRLLQFGGCQGDGVWAEFGERSSGTAPKQVEADMLVGCDGIHSTVRSALYPDEGPARWNGVVMWRGVAVGKPFLSGRTMINAGSSRQRHVLMTSRETIGVNGEVVWQVPPLPVDSGADSTTDSVAAQLFADRASAIAPGFRLTADNASDIHQICARLDGLPLAIELAAARVRVLSPHQIAQRLDDRFALLTGASSKRGTTSPDAAGSG